MNKTAPLFTLLILMAVGCKTGWINPSEMSKINVGMPKTDVIEILGTPHSAEGQQNKETLWYMEDQGRWIHRGHFVTLVDGKVESYGRGIPTAPENTLNLNIKEEKP